MAGCVHGGGMHGRWHVWQGEHALPGGMWWGHVWWGACVTRGVHGRGMCGQGACMAGGMCGKGACMAGEMAIAADGMHPTGILSC